MYPFPQHNIILYCTLQLQLGVCAAALLSVEAPGTLCVTTSVNTILHYAINCTCCVILHSTLYLYNNDL